MNNEKLKKIFSESLSLPILKINDDLAYNEIKEWDSISHMSLVAEIESEFDIMLDTEDIINMNSFIKAREILENYGISF